MKQIIKQLIAEGILVSPDLMDGPLDVDTLLMLKEKHTVIDRKLYDAHTPKEKEEKPKEDREYVPVQVAKNFDDQNVKIDIRDFISMYNSRFRQLQSILRQRQELQGVTSLRKIANAPEREQVTAIAMILEIRKTRNDHFMMTLEDQTGTMRAIITKNNKEAYTIAKDLTPDEVIGVIGSKGDKIVFINTVISPEVPLNKELKKSPVDEAVLFIGDVHVGSNVFLEKNFQRFIDWLKGKVGNSQQKFLAKKVKYLFILGDLVEGIGIFPGQEKELHIEDIYEQFNIFSKFIMQLPEDLHIIICPGNHDPLRVAEPQPPIPREYLPEVYERKNTYFVSSPSIVRIGKSGHFPGFDVLVYHGYSFPFYANNVESLRRKGGLEKTEFIMEYLLKKRHLAPTHGSTQYQMGYKKDPLVIEKVPDFWVTGHIHRASMRNYKNVTLLNCSCWISQTPYQEKRGLVPEPARAIYVDLKTRDTKMLNFS